MKGSAMPLLVRVRPNAGYLVFTAVCAAVAVYAFAHGGVAGVVAGCVLSAMLIFVASPIILSTLLRTPAVVVTEEGLRFPLLGPRLRWDEIAAVRRSVALVGPRPRPVLLIVPTVAEAVIRQVRPWLRPDVRKNLARYGTPLALFDNVLDHSVDDIFAVVQRYRPSADEVA
jgi:hypothetical protein